MFGRKSLKHIRERFRSPGPVTTGFFTPGLAIQCLVPLVALALAWLLYTLAVAWCYRTTWKAYRSGNVFAALREEMPRVFDGRTSSKPPEDREKRERSLLLLFLQKMGLVPVEETLDRLGKDKTFQWLAQRLTEGRAGKVAFYESPTLGMVAEAALSLGSQRPQWIKENLFLEDLSGLMAGMLSDYPNARSRYEEFLTSSDRKKHELPLQGALPDEKLNLMFLWLDLLTPGGDNFGRIGIRFNDGFQWHITSTAATEDQVLHLLYRQASLAGNAMRDEAPLAEKRVEPAGELARDDLQRIDAFFSSLITRMQALPEVKRAGLWMSVARGYEQFFMLWAFLWMALLLGVRSWKSHRERSILTQLRSTAVPLALRYYQMVNRHVNPANLLKVTMRKSFLQRRSVARVMLLTCTSQLTSGTSESAKERLESVASLIRQSNSSTRWSLVWLSRVIPGLGFIGTVHGIALALMGADSIVRAATPAAQAAAINLVAGNLGVSFTTTFIALVMGIFLSWWNDLQAHRERAFVTLAEREVGYFLDPAQFTTDA